MKFSQQRFFLFPLLIMTFCAGCATNITGSRVTVPLAPEAGSYRSMAVAVYSESIPGAPELQFISSQIIARARQAGLYDTLVDQIVQPDAKADAGLAVAIADIRRGSKPSVASVVRLIDLKTKRILGEAVIEGKSSITAGGNGTIEEAMDKLTIQIVDFLSHRGAFR